MNVVSSILTAFYSLDEFCSFDKIRTKLDMTVPEREHETARSISIMTRIKIQNTRIKLHDHTENHVTCAN